LKTPYRDDTTHVIFEPLDFTACLAVLAPDTLALLAGQALASIEDSVVIRKILAQVGEAALVHDLIHSPCIAAISKIQTLPPPRAALQ